MLRAELFSKIVSKEIELPIRDLPDNHGHRPRATALTCTVEDQPRLLNEMFSVFVSFV